MLADSWAPMFRLVLGIGRAEMLDMSVPEMVDHLDYWDEMTRSRDG